jgi:hypothetical protein
MREDNYMRLELMTEDNMCDRIKRVNGDDMQNWG